MARKGDILVVRTGAVYRDRDGRRRHLRKGQTIEHGHELIKGREHLFKPLEVTYPITVKA